MVKSRLLARLTAATSTGTTVLVAKVVSMLLIATAVSCVAHNRSQLCCSPLQSVVLLTIAVSCVALPGLGLPNSTM